MDPYRITSRVLMQLVVYLQSLWRGLKTLRLLSGRSVFDEDALFRRKKALFFSVF